MRITEKQVEDAVRFHGHECPGLWIGIRAAELCLSKIGANTARNPIVCVVETDMCGVDAIQTLTGCTFGKGNLIHRDYGKTAFTFFNRSNGKGLRAVLKPDIHDNDKDEMDRISKRIAEGAASDDDRKKMAVIRENMKNKIMKAELNELFSEGEPGFSTPRPARVLESRACAGCGEAVMESRVRLLGGSTLCIPCFEKSDQKR